MSRLATIEYSALKKDLPELLDHGEDILASTLLRSVEVTVATCTHGGGVIRLGSLIEAWNQGAFRMPCACGANACVYWVSASMLMIRSQVVALCPACGERLERRDMGGLSKFLKPMWSIQERRRSEGLDATPTTLPLRLVVPVLRGEPPLTEVRDADGNMVMRYDHIAKTACGNREMPVADEGVHGKWVNVPPGFVGSGSWGSEGRGPWRWIYAAQDGSGMLFAFGDGVLHRLGVGDALLMDEEIPPAALTWWIEEQLGAVPASQSDSAVERTPASASEGGDR